LQPDRIREVERVSNPVKIDLGGFSLNYVLEGPESAPCITFSNSLVCDLAMWDVQAAKLRDRYRVLRYDQRGHGASDAPPTAYSMDDLGNDVIALWDKLGIEQSHWIGLSLGGMTGINLALRYPTRLLSLIASDCRAEAPPPYAAVFEERIRITQAEGMAAMVEPSIARFFTEAFTATGGSQLDKVRRMIGETSAEGHVGCCEAIRGLAYDARLPEIDMAVLFMGGEHDMGAPPAVMRAMADAVPGARYEVVTGAGHISNIEKPDAFQTIIEQFLSEL
jgi:3-oxoadipate enol-lactonase